MPKLEFSQQELKAYFSEDKNAYHCFYDKALEYAGDMCVHADGLFPDKLIKDRRPNEPQEVYDYRETIFVPKTKPVFSKIISSLSKIRRSSDWSIKYDGEFTKISEGETLQDYCELYYPQFTSVTNWIFSVWLKKYLVDPNAVIFIYPEFLPEQQNEYLRPFTYIFDSFHVIDYVHDDYAVLVNPEGCTYTTSKGDFPGKSFYVVTTQKIFRYDQSDGRGNMTLMLDYEHGLEGLPVYRIGAVIVEAKGMNFLYESRIAGVKPEFDEAIREYSDLQAAKVLHIYPERWEYTQHECNECKGTGRKKNPAWHDGCAEGTPVHVECDNKGCYKGYIATGPYSKILVRPNSAMDGQSAIPNPPAGYVEKDVEIVKVQEESITKHITDGLAAINFEFLINTPLNQSGTAKEVDKDELNNTVHSIAEDMVRNMDWIYWNVAKYRYRLLYNDDHISEMVPTISVPEKYDILSTSHLEAQLKNAKDSNANAAIVNALEVEYANKAFNSDPSVRDMVELVLSLDPLANISEDDKMSRLSNKGISQTDYIISSNINEFIRRAIDEDAGFVDKDRKMQKQKMAEYAVELEAENSLKVDMNAGIREDINGDIYDNDTEDDKDNNGVSDVDQIGKLPLAIQQLSLAAQRASETGNATLAKRLNNKINELLIEVGV